MAVTLRRQILLGLRDLPERDAYKVTWFSVEVVNYGYSIKLNAGLTYRELKRIQFTTFQWYPIVVLCLQKLELLPCELILNIVKFYMQTENITHKVNSMLVLYNKALKDIQQTELL